MTERSSASVVIPSYNMGWCITRAVKSCQVQSTPVSEIIIVDDCSTDNTQEVVKELMAGDGRIKCLRAGQNEGHLSALRAGVQSASSDWVALLDADDELTPESIAIRIDAAAQHRNLSGVLPQLVYGDHFSEARGAVTHFPMLKGYAFSFLCRELALCPTSTIMLGKECLRYFPVSDGWNTDDEIVLAVGKHFPVLHSGDVVSIYHTHASPTRMANNPKQRFRGVYQLVRDHHGDVFRAHGMRYVLLWYLRIARAFIRYQIAVADGRTYHGLPAGPGVIRRCMRLQWRIYRKCLGKLHESLGTLFRRHFVMDAF
jgi:glycosyltransferase involved in cell wall biosynthesis